MIFYSLLVIVDHCVASMAGRRWCCIHGCVASIAGSLCCIHDWKEEVVMMAVDRMKGLAVHHNLIPLQSSIYATYKTSLNG